MSIQVPIIAANDIQILFEIADSSTLVLSDITNTLYKPCNTMSDKKWRTYLAGRIKAMISDPGLASRIANRLENIIVNQVDKELVDHNAPTVIGQLQVQGIPFIAISLKSWSTSYDPDFGLTTSNHLEKLGIHLEKSVPLLGKLKPVDNPTYTFAKGIIFANKEPLDQTLDHFLSRLEKKPARIVIFENDSSQKEKLEAVSKAHQIALSFVRHSLSDERKSSFDPVLGTIEFLRFMEDQTVVLDKEAEKIKSGSVDHEAQLEAFIQKYAHAISSEDRS